LSIFDKIIKNCRLCQKHDLSLQIDLGQVPLGNNLSSLYEESMEVEEYPLCINRCNTCGHFQLNYSVAPEKLYVKNYSYLSGIGKSFLDHLEWSKSDILDFILPLKSNVKVLDIGSNDGSALKFFQNTGAQVLGVDPAKLPAKIANENNIPTINNFFSKLLSESIKKTNGTFDIIISHNVLAHVEDLNDVFDGIANLLELGGTLIFEIGYFGNLIKNNIIDTIYHEHLDYHTKKSLSNFLVLKGFEVIKILENDIQGGSIRLYCKKSVNNIIHEQVKRSIQSEISLLSSNSIIKWEKTIHDKFTQIKDIILKAKAEGKNLVGYGAPTKATLFLKKIKLSQGDIRFIIEDNNLKVGCYLPKTGIPIIHFKDYKSNRNDFIICFAWNFYKDIYFKLKKNKISGTLFNILSMESKVL
jgi:SAM-dependent methyltransferase